MRRYGTTPVDRTRPGGWPRRDALGGPVLDQVRQHRGSQPGARSGAQLQSVDPPALTALRHPAGRDRKVAVRQLGRFPGLAARRRRLDSARARGLRLCAVSVSDPDRSAAPAPTTRTSAEAAAPAPRETVDLHALAPLAVWIRATQGDPAFHEVCTAAGVSPEAFSNGGGRVPRSQLETWLSALRDRIGGDGALLAAGMGGETPPPATSAWLRWIASPGVLYRGRGGRRWVTAGAGRIAVRRGGLGAATVQYTTAEPEGRVVCLWRQA